MQTGLLRRAMTFRGPYLSLLVLMVLGLVFGELFNAGQAGRSIGTYQMGHM